MSRDGEWSTSQGTRQIGPEPEPLHLPVGLPPRPARLPEPEAHEAPGPHSSVIVIDNDDGDSWPGAIVIDLV